MELKRFYLLPTETGPIAMKTIPRLVVTKTGMRLGLIPMQMKKDSLK
jgi:hypothetical protein